MPNAQLPPAWMRGLRRGAAILEGRDYKRGEDLFRLILSGLREVFDIDAVIAGGAVRDLSCGITNPKDVDVFLPLPSDTFLKGHEELGWMGPTGMMPKPKEYDKIAGKKCVVPVLARGMSNVQGIPVDLVFMAEPLSKEDVSSFPVYAQRCVYTLKEGPDLSPEAEEDISGKKFTIDPTITDKERLKTVLEKVRGWQRREGYHDWTIVEPDLKEWWEAKDELDKQEKEVKKPDSPWDKYWKEAVAEAGLQGIQEAGNVRWHQEFDLPQPREPQLVRGRLAWDDVQAQVDGQIFRVRVEGDERNAPEEPE